MKYQLRVHMGRGVILEKTFEADCMVIQQSTDTVSRTIDLDHKCTAIVALHYAVPKAEGLPETEFDCLATLAALSDKEAPE